MRPAGSAAHRPEGPATMSTATPTAAASRLHDRLPREKTELTPISLSSNLNWHHYSLQPGEALRSIVGDLAWFHARRTCPTNGPGASSQWVKECGLSRRASFVPNTIGLTPIPLNFAAIPTYGNSSPHSGSHGGGSGATLFQGRLEARVYFSHNSRICSRSCGETHFVSNCQAFETES